ncbi:hypothetical protein, partial [Tetragenococcus halophilus]|uniref:hypothetical protein n=1 Tax=Tetragenococcus halophilus TaxID=51669 RepID=UPI0030C908C3
IFSHDKVSSSLDFIYFFVSKRGGRPKSSVLKTPIAHKKEPSDFLSKNKNRLVLKLYFKT